MLKYNLTYNDIPFIMTKNPFTGDLNLVKDVNAIKQSVKNIILTIRRERPFNMAFGANPRNSLFDTLTTLTEIECKNLISSSIATFERRVELKDIGIEQSRINPNRINILVIYSIIDIGIVDSIVVSLERTR